MTEQVIAKSYDDGVYKEFEASAALDPGMVLEYTGENSQGDLQVGPVSSIEKTGAGHLVAREQRMPPRTGSSDPRELSYASGENVEAYHLQPGEEAFLLLAAGSDLASASDANISIDDRLGTNDDGTLKASTTAGAQQFVALEAVDNSGAASGEHAFIRVEAI